MFAYNYFIFVASTGANTAWGTFTSPEALGVADIASKARRLADAHFISDDVCCDIYTADPTSGDFDTDWGCKVASYSTHENA